MNSSPKSFSLFQAALLTGAIATSATILAPSWSRVSAAWEDSPKAIVDEVWQIVNTEYVDGTFNKQNWQNIRQELLSREYTSREQAYTAVRNALKRLDDPYTRFLDPKQYKALTSQTSGELTGVGLRLGVNEDSKVLTVVEPMANSPAIKAGLQAGDQILSIDGKATKDMPVEVAANLIRGEVGSKVKLKLKRQGKGEFEVTLTRAQIEIATVTHQVKQEGQMRVGYIRLNEFSAHAADQMRTAIRDLSGQKVDGFVLDLRGNPGGLLQASVEIARMWLDRGTIVRTVDRRGDNEEYTTNRSALTQLPLTVLVDGNSASASEILSGALKDNQRATIVGSQTFGKALVQSVHGLADGSGLAVTIAHYYTPNGTDISHKGVTPDVKVDLTEAQQQTLGKNPSRIGTLEDPQYMKAISVLQNEVIAKTGRLSRSGPNNRL